MSLPNKKTYRFGDFLVDNDQKLLLCSGIPTSVTPKVFETLLVLVEHSGRLVSKEELMSRVWPDSFVEESNLTFNIQQLRKCLGDDARNPRFIETVSRRGYRFIAPVEAQEVNLASPHTPAANPVAAPSRLTTEDHNSQSRRHRRRLLTLAFAIVVVLGVTAVVLWKVSKTKNKNLGELVAVLPLRIERMTASGQSNNAAISPDGKYLAYTRTVEGKQSIWLRQLATNANVEIVKAKDRIFGVAFANSGEYIYFVRGAPTALYRVSLLGDVPIKILDKLEGRFSVSPDDHQIAFIRVLDDAGGHEAYSLMIANSDGTAEHTLLARDYPDKLDTPSWSSAGDSIICTHGNTSNGSQSMSLLEVNLTDGATRELSTERFANITRIAALPHQQGLIMSAVKTLEGYRQLWFVSFPNMEFKEITAGLSSYSDLSVAANANKMVASQITRAFDIWVGETRDVQHIRKVTGATEKFCWTPDQKLVYSAMANGSADLWLMRADGQEQRQLTVNAATNSAPAVTPDGRSIVFISNRDGAFQIWRMNIDGSNPTRMTAGGSKNFPAIAPDGRWILYNTTDDWRLWKVPIDGGEPIRLTDYYALLPSVSPDGKMIACLGRNGSKAALLVLSSSGGPPIKTFELAGQTFSGTRIQWTADGKDLTYATELDGMTELVRQPLFGGKSEEVIKVEDEILDFGYSDDGKLLAVTRGGWQHDIVLFSDLNLR